jgi:hypothetical protein
LAGEEWRERTDLRFLPFLARWLHEAANLGKFREMFGGDRDLGAGRETGVRGARKIVYCVAAGEGDSKFSLSFVDGCVHMDGVSEGDSVFQDAKIGRRPPARPWRVQFWRFELAAPVPRVFVSKFYRPG